MPPFRISSCSGELVGHRQANVLLRKPGFRDGGLVLEGAHSSSLSRRDFMRGASAAFALAGARQARAAWDGWIDVHHHLAPPAYSAFQRTLDQFPPALKSLTPQRALDAMNLAGVRMAITSIASPGVWAGNYAKAVDLARACNEYAAELMARFPGRFGMFATLPLPSVRAGLPPSLDGSLREVAHAFDTLKANGVQLWTNYGDKWLGDPFLDPLFEELDRRKAVIFVHPRVAPCCTNLLPHITANVVEYGTETTRAIANFVFNGASTRFRNVRMIFSHAGGTMPFLISRFLVEASTPIMKNALPTGILPELARFYYETAQTTHPAPMSALRRVVPVSHILYGSDFPYRSLAEQISALRDGNVFSDEELRLIARVNAADLLRRRAT